LSVEFVRKYPNFRFCLRVGGREVVHRPIVEEGKVMLVEE
jgi:hypothetical protein